MFPGKTNFFRAEVAVDGFSLPAQLGLRQRYEERGVAEITVVFRDFIFEH
jgi:hypothetical protein